jgi:hypothetical protein
MPPPARCRRRTAAHRRSADARKFARTRATAIAISAGQIVGEGADDAEFVGARRLELLGLAQHAVEGRGGLRPAAVGHHHGADAGHDAERDLRQLHPGALQRDDAVAAHRQLEAAAQRHAVQRGDHRLLHRVQVHQQARAVARVLRAAAGVAQHIDGKRPMSAPAQKARVP